MSQGLYLIFKQPLDQPSLFFRFFLKLLDNLDIVFSQRVFQLLDSLDQLFVRLALPVPVVVVGLHAVRKWMSKSFENVHKSANYVHMR